MQVVDVPVVFDLDVPARDHAGDRVLQVQSVGP